MSRHEPLHTNIVQEEGAPVGLLRPPAQPSALLALEDLAGCSPDHRERRLEAGLVAEAVRPFDLAADPLLRARLFRLSQDEHCLALTIHHAASDGASEAIVHRELAAAYAMRRVGGAAAFPPLSVTYADHAAWLADWLGQSGERTRQAAYWRRTLAGAPVRLTLPADRARDEGRAGPAGVAPLRIGDALTARLQSLAETCGATLFAVLLAGWAAVLGRLSGQEDVVIGAPTAGRDREETTGLVGFFVNTIALRLDLAGRPDARALVARARDVVLGALDHQAIPFDQVLEQLELPRSRLHAPLFQAMFAWQSEEVAALTLTGLDVQPVDTPRPPAKFELILQLRPATGGGLAGGIEFDSDLFEAATVNRWAGRLLAVLEGMAAQAGVAEGGAPVGSLPILTRAERLEAVGDLGQSRAGLPGTDIAGTFERQVAAAPDAVALVLGERSLTYRQLDALGDLLARRLAEFGVGPEVVTAVVLGRSVEAIVAILAILKAGGAYLPLSPDEPIDRLRFMLRDSGAELMITAAERVAFAADLLPVVTFGSLMDAPSEVAGPPRAPRSRMSKNALAYIIYTSGSTGSPKGVGVTQGAVVSLAWRPDFAPLGPGHSVLQFAPLAFDAATFEIWGALLNGARLVLAPATLFDLDLLETLIREEAIDTLWMTAGLFAQAVETHPGLFTGVSRLLVGGDVVPPAAAGRGLGRHRDLTLINGYGPTETTTFACVHPITAADVARGAIPIGSAIAGAGVLVLDETLDLCPPGVAGELYIVGAGLARGYVGAPALTAERFIACPFGPPGSRMYRTGDRARRRADGVIEFLGRLDNQVKVRGFRVEPGEIEAALRTSDDVADAVVVPREVAGETRLVAYVVAVAGRPPPDRGSLRAMVARRLAEPLIPAAFVTLPALPLTANGKVDRRALPPPRWDGQEGGRRPATPTEASLCRLFSTLTGADDVGVDDNFFELGGHSLLGVRLMFEIERQFGEKLPLGALFQSPTAAGLAQRLSQGAADDFVSLAPLFPLGDSPPLFMVHWVERDVARHLRASNPVFALSFGLGGRIGHDELELPQGVEAIAAHYVAELRAFRPVGPYHLIGHSAGGLLAFEMARQLSEAGCEVGLVALLDSHIPQPRSERRRASWPDTLHNLMRTPAKVIVRYIINKIVARLEVMPLLRRAMLRFLPSPATLRLRLVSKFMYDYEPRPFAGRVWLFKCTADPFYVRTVPPPPPELAWARVARGGLVVRGISAGHLTMVKDPLAEITAHAIRDALAELSPLPDRGPSPGAD